MLSWLGDQRDLGQELLQRRRTLATLALELAVGVELARRRRPAPRGSRSGPRPRSCARPRAPRCSPVSCSTASSSSATGPRRSARSRSAAIVSAKRPTAFSAAEPRPGIAVRVGEHLPDVGADRVRVREHPRLGLLADPAPRRVDDAAERDRVGGVGEQLQVGDRVLDLGALVELRPADHLVGDLESHQRVLEHPALRVHPVEDRDLVARRALLDQPVDLGGDVAGLGVLVVELADDDLLAALAPSVHRCFGFWSTLWAISALAASRIVWVER